MSDTVNPYQSPETAAAPAGPLTAQGALTETMLIYLKQASPWLRFIGIVGYIGAGFTALWGVVFFFLGSFAGRAWSSLKGFESFFNLSDGEISGGAGVALGIMMGLLIIGCAAIIFFPSRFAYRFGSKIRTYLREGRDQDLELAFKNNKSFWKFYGIICIIYLAFIPLVMIISIIAAVASALS